MITTQATMTQVNPLDATAASHLGALVDVYPEARELGDLFHADGHELYLVGGTVRDTLLAGGDPRALDHVDLDFATSARPAVSERLLRRWTRNGGAVWLTGAEFGTVSAERGGRQIEVTTFRSDNYAAGSRHPEVTFGDTIAADVARRDFTVNAMAVRVGPQFEFIDLHGGLSDLNGRRLRTPIDPHQSFRDDPLRLVRLARFAAALGAEPDPATQRAAVEMAGELATISAERIRDELIKLLTSADPARGIHLLVDTGLSAWCLPEVAELRACRDPMHRHKDVYKHTLAVVDNAIALEDEGPERLLRLAALLHDIGKPATREIRRDGTVTFHHHEVVGAKLARKRLRALRFDNQTVKDVSQLVYLHLRFHTYEMGWTDAAVRRYVRDAGHLLGPLNKLTRADVTTGNPRKAARIQRRVDELERRIAELRSQEELNRLRPAIDGNQIMRHLDLSPGPLVGAAWNHLLELRIEQGPMTPEEALAALDEWWKDHQEDPGG